MTKSASATLNALIGATPAADTAVEPGLRRLADVVHSLELAYSDLTVWETMLSATVSDRLAAKEARLLAALKLGDTAAARDLAAAASKFAAVDFPDCSDHYRNLLRQPVRMDRTEFMMLREREVQTAREALTVSQLAFYATLPVRMPETVPMFTPSEIPEVHATLRRSRHRPSRPLWQFTVADDTTEAGRAELAPLAEWLKTAELADPWWANCTSIDNPLLEVACSPGHRNVRLTFDRTDSSGTAFADPFSADEFETFLERLVAAGNDETDVFCLTLAAAVRKNPNDKRFLDRYVDWACVQEGAVHLTACYHNPAFTVDQLLQLIELELSAGFTYVVRRLAELAPEKFAEFTVGDAVVVANITAALKDNWLNTPEPSEGSVKVPHPLAPVWENISNELAVAVMRTNPTVLARGLSQGIVPAGPVKQVNRKRFADALSEVSFEDGGAVTAVGWLAQLPARDVIPILEAIAADFDRHDDFDMPEELLAFLAGHLDRVGDRREELLAAMAKSGKPLGVLAEKYMAPST